MNNFEKEPGFNHGVVNFAGADIPDTNVEQQHHNLTILRAHIENGEIRIVTNLSKDVAQFQADEHPDQVEITTLHDSLVDDGNDDDNVTEPAPTGFLYIGTNLSHYNFLLSRFNFGYKKKNLDDAGKFSLDLYMQNKRLPDVLFVDLPLQQPSLESFCSGMKRNLLLSNLPVIYAESQLSDAEVDELAGLNLVDDILLLDNTEIDYVSKALFLKQCKLYNHTINVARTVLKKHQKFRRRFSMTMKRLLDLLLAGIALVLLSPVLVIIAIMIRVDSNGPVFYTSLRAGRGFKVFRFYKFRSMVPGAEKGIDEMSHLNQYSATEGPKFFKVSKDPRVTKFGRFIRNTSVDELPQLFNVIKGDMSLVGNRPLPLYEAVSLTTDEFVERFSAPAGITGLWQVNKRGKSEMSTEERIHLDITYSRRHSFLYDLRIMAKTPVALLQKSDV